MRNNQFVYLGVIFSFLAFFYIFNIKNGGGFFTPQELILYFHNAEISIKSSVISGGITFLSLLLTLHFGRREWERQTKIKEKITIYNTLSDQFYLALKSIIKFRKFISDSAIKLSINDLDIDYENIVEDLNENCFELLELSGDIKFFENKHIYEIVDSMYVKGDVKQVSNLLNDGFISLWPMVRDVMNLAVGSEEEEVKKSDISDRLFLIENELVKLEGAISEALLQYSHLMKGDLYEIKKIVNKFKEKHD